MGLSPQRPLYRAYQQSPEAMQRWRDEQFPAIRKQAKAEGATIYFADEAGIRSQYHAGPRSAECLVPALERIGAPVIVSGIARGLLEGFRGGIIATAVPTAGGRQDGIARDPIRSRRRAAGRRGRSTPGFGRGSPPAPPAAPRPPGALAPTGSRTDTSDRPVAAPENRTPDAASPGHYQPPC